MNTSIEDELKKIDHYQKFPLMKPFIGENYFNAPQKVMVIGESFFFDHYPQNENPKINPGAQVWYSSTENELQVEKQLCIDTRHIVKTSKHHFYISLEKILSQSLEYTKSKGSKAVHNIVFMNAFQRPANHKGQSIKGLAVEQDFQIASTTISQVIEIVKPSFVIFVSKYSWDNVGIRLQKQENILYDYTVHPASYGEWHDKKNIHSKYKFLKLLKDYGQLSNRANVQQEYLQ